MATSRERLGSALQHRAGDRIPFDQGSTAVTGIHVRMVEALRREYGLPYLPVKMVEPYMFLGEIDPALADAMGIDVVGIGWRNTLFGYENQGEWREFRTFWGQVVLVPPGFATSLDDNGDLLIHPQGDRSARPRGRMPKAGFFFDTIIHQDPIDEEKLDPRDNMEEFGPLPAADLEHYRAAVERYRACGATRGLIISVPNTGLGDIALVPAPWMKSPHGVRDVAEWYMSLMARPDYVRAVFDRQTEIAVKNLEAVHRVAGDAPQAIILCGTDFGTQDSQFCSPQTFRELYLPYYRRMTDWIHAHTPWKVLKHSCGSVVPLLEAFIDAGFDILNPVQINALHMDPAMLKREFGDRLVFWGGGVDTQKVLPFARPAEVEAHVQRQCEILGKGGGFVFNAVHNIQANVPVENVVAMVRAFKRFNGIS
jgi:hypothetical protein